MAITLGQSVTGKDVRNSTSTTLTMPGAVTAGSGLTAACSAWRGGVSDPNVTYSDSVNGAHTRDRNVTDANVDSVSIASKANTSSGTPTMTYTMNGGSGSGFFGVLDFREWVNLATSSHTDVGTTSSGTSSTASTGTTAATAQADEVAIGVTANGQTTAALTENAGGEGFTLSIENQDGTNNINSGIVYKILSATGAQVHTWTLAGSTGWCGAIQTYKGSGGGGGGVTVKALAALGVG